MDTLLEKDKNVTPEMIRSREKDFIDNFMACLLKKCLTRKEVKQALELSDDYFNFGSFEHNVRDYHRRQIMCKKYTFAIPYLEILEVIKNNEPILEIGAGSGFWGALFRKIGCDVTVTTVDDKYHPFPLKFTEVENISGLDAIKKYSDRTVLWVWPSMEEWTVDVLKNIKGKLIYVGEDPGGCTGTDEYHDILGKDFKVIQSEDMLQWWGIHDNLYIYERENI